MTTISKPEWKESFPLVKGFDHLKLRSIPGMRQPIPWQDNGVDSGAIVTEQIKEIEVFAKSLKKEVTIDDFF